MIIEGSISVKAALQGKRRDVTSVYADERLDDRNTRYILRLAETQEIPVIRTVRTKIDAMASGRTHGGLLAEVSSRRYDDPSSALQGEKTFIVLCEGVEDPFNLGYIMRSLYSAGCTGLIVGQRDWSRAESTILRASAGAFDLLNVIMSEDPEELLRQYKQAGVYVYAAMRKDACELYEADLTGPVLIMIGGEMRGLSRSVLQEADRNLYIPYANDFRNALNASSAAAVIAYEALRQRRKD